jgi:hypothetical protein
MLKPASAGSASGTSCSVLGIVDWNLVVEWENELSQEDDFSSFPAVLPAPAQDYGWVMLPQEAFTLVLDGRNGSRIEQIAKEPGNEQVSFSLDEQG